MRQTDLRCADLYPVWFYSVKILAVYSHHVRITRKWSWELERRKAEKADVVKLKVETVLFRLFFQWVLYLYCADLSLKAHTQWPACHSRPSLSPDSVTKRKSCWHDSSLNFCLSPTGILCESLHLYPYLSNTHPSDMYVRLQRKVQTCVELSDVELCWGKLHCCHLVAEVGWHHMLTEDQNCVWIVCRQEIQVGAPLKERSKWNF